ncbi:ArsR/SmtB family transcription factor [Hippea jasoniae]|uniref:ArsR/SmtB family transcription factor n=1 Tax=Hippea jasoniae TaxID=944479 RepID=UPI00068CCC6F|nr:metalloregulator ArsR/SmtB family transcription factor [Hippea jasoniae]
MKDMKHFELLAGVGKAIDHPLRIAIVQYLLEVGQPKCVTHLADKFNRTQSIISKSLAKLESAGLVKRYKVGVFVRYGIPDVEKTKTLLECLNYFAQKKAEYHSAILGE